MLSSFWPFFSIPSWKKMWWLHSAVSHWQEFGGCHYPCTGRTQQWRVKGGRNTPSPKLANHLPCRAFCLFRCQGCELHNNHLRTHNTLLEACHPWFPRTAQEEKKHQQWLLGLIASHLVVIICNAPQQWFLGQCSKWCRSHKRGCLKEEVSECTISLICLQ